MQDQGDGVPAAPVFVDPSGRRSRRVQRVLWALSGLLGCYLALVAVSLVGTPGLSRLTVPGVGPVLPGPAAPALGTTTGARRAPARLLPPAVSPSPRRAASPAPETSRAASAAPTSSRAGSPSPTSLPSVVPSPSPSGPPRATPSPSPAPASNRASPRNSRAPTAHPSRPPR